MFAYNLCCDCYNEPISRFELELFYLGKEEDRYARIMCQENRGERQQGRKRKETVCRAHHTC